MVFDEPRSVLQEQINKILSTPDSESILYDLVELSLLKDARKNENQLVIPEIYNLLGVQTFASLLNLVDGKTITFPTKAEFKNTVLTCLTYYLRTELGMSWDDIKEELKSPDLNTVRLGINGSTFESWLEEQYQRLDEQTKRKLQS